jgi:hypothetical protein
VASFTGEQAAETGVDLSVSEAARYYLIWITSLASYDDGYRVEIGSVRLTAGE